MASDGTGRKGMPKVDNRSEGGTDGTDNPPTLEVTTLRPADVFAGRGAPMVYYSGNIQYRELIRTRQAEFCSARRRARKSEIAIEIMAEIYSRDGRFLRRPESQEEAQKLGVSANAWILMSDEQAIVKIKQALRHRSKPSVSGLPKRSNRTTREDEDDDDRSDADDNGSESDDDSDIEDDAVDETNANLASLPVTAASEQVIHQPEQGADANLLNPSQFGPVPVNWQLAHPTLPNGLQPDFASASAAVPFLAQLTQQHQQQQQTNSILAASRMTHSLSVPNLQTVHSAPPPTPLQSARSFSQLSEQQRQLRIEEEALAVESRRIELRRAQLNIQNQFLEAQKASILQASAADMAFLPQLPPPPPQPNQPTWLSFKPSPAPLTGPASAGTVNPPPPPQMLLQQQQQQPNQPMFDPAPLAAAAATAASLPLAGTQRQVANYHIQQTTQLALEQQETHQNQALYTGNLHGLAPPPTTTARGAGSTMATLRPTARTLTNALDQLRESYDRAMAYSSTAVMAATDPKDASVPGPVRMDRDSIMADNHSQRSHPPIDPQNQPAASAATAHHSRPAAAEEDGNIRLSSSASSSSSSDEEDGKPRAI